MRERRRWTIYSHFTLTPTLSRREKRISPRRYTQVNAVLGSSALIVCVCLAGCTPRPIVVPWLSPPAADSPPPGVDRSPENAKSPLPTAASADSSSRPNDNRAAFSIADWIRVTSSASRSESPADAAAQPSVYRWRHAAIEKTLTTVGADRLDLPALLKDRSPVVAANAAVVLARQGDTRAAERLTAAVGDRELKLSLRCAAAESLALLPGPATLAALRTLCDEQATAGPRGTAAAQPELYAELVRGLARHVDAADDPRLLAALKCPSPQVRVEAFRAWAVSKQGVLPREAVESRSDSDPRVRAAVAEAIGARRPPKATEYLAEALRDGDLQVRLAAIAALGQQGDAQSRAILAELAKDRSERLRAEAVAALACSGAKSAVLAAVADPSWRVRLKVAEALEHYVDRDGAAVASRLLDDPSAEVQRQAVLSAARWPLELAGPILLDGLGKASLVTRRAAAEQLAARWPAAAEFPVEGPPARRAEVLARLQAEFPRYVADAAHATGAAGFSGRGQAPFAAQQPEGCSAQMATVPFAFDPGVVMRVEQLLREGDMAALGRFGPELVGLLEHLAVQRHQVLPEAVFQDVLPRHDPVYRSLAELKSSDTTQRRRAADELAAKASSRSLGRLATARLAMLMVDQADALVWFGVLEAIASDPGPSSAQVAYLGLEHSAPEVRRRACEHLASHPEPAHARFLHPRIHDDSPSVAVAAVRALGAGHLADPRPLQELLASAHVTVRLEAAIALARAGDALGKEDLQRLAFHEDPRVRARVAQAVGEMGDSAFTALLVQMLDDRRATVSRAALLSLPKVAGSDAAVSGGAATTTQQQIQRWKEWFAGQGLGK